MPTDQAAVRERISGVRTVSVTDADAILYAMGAGFGAADRSMPYIAETRGLRTVPTLASLVVMRDLARALEDLSQRPVLVGEELQVHRPLPAPGEFSISRRISDFEAAGRHNQDGLEIETELSRRRDDAVVATLRSRLLLAAPQWSEPQRPAGEFDRHDRAADFVHVAEVSGRMPLLFRLVGDRHPVFADSMAARRFDRPAAVLDDSLVQGIACRAILETVCDYDYTLIGHFTVRFAGLVPHDAVLTTEMWQDGNLVRFRSRAGDGQDACCGTCLLNA